jgi:hypothetical protein
MIDCYHAYGKNLSGQFRDPLGRTGKQKEEIDTSVSALSRLLSRFGRKLFAGIDGGISVLGGGGASVFCAPFSARLGTYFLWICLRAITWLPFSLCSFGSALARNAYFRIFVCWQRPLLACAVAPFVARVYCYCMTAGKVFAGGGAFKVAAEEFLACQPRRRRKARSCLRRFDSCAALISGFGRSQRGSLSLCFRPLSLSFPRRPTTGCGATRGT